MNGGINIEAFVPKFADENRDRIQKLNRYILDFEKNPANAELLKEILREAHTLKGTARMMGFADIVAVSHKVEDIFVKIRECRLQPAKDIYTVVFQALDVIAGLVEMKLKDRKETRAGNEICCRIDAVLKEVGAGGTERELSQLEVDKVLSGGMLEQSEPFAFEPEGSKAAAGNGTQVFGTQSVNEDAGKKKSAREGQKTVRIGLNKVEVLYNSLVELIMIQMSFHQKHDDIIRLGRYAKQAMMLKTEKDSALVGQGLEDNDLRRVVMRYSTAEKEALEGMMKLSDTYEAEIVRFDAVMEGVRQQVMSMRMQPISTIFDLAPRLVRDLLDQFSKEADLRISGSEVELDNTIIEMLKDPIVHLLRNAVDHGIEEPAVRLSAGKKKSGTIVLSAKQDSGDVLVTVEDDGKGIDKEAVKEAAVSNGLLNGGKDKYLPDEEIYRLILIPGFTTSKIITDTSGRGVGMDVVQTVVDRLNGSLAIESDKGRGTKFILRVPATVSLMYVLIVRVGTATFAIPSGVIERIVFVYRKDVKTLEGKDSAFVEGQTIPLVWVSDVFALGKEEKTDGKNIPVIVSRSEGKRVGFAVDEFLHEKEVVFREFKGYLKRPKFFSGVTTLGTGEVVLILNMQELIKVKDMAKVLAAEVVPNAVKDADKKSLVLIAEDSMITAELEKNILINAGYEVDVAIDGIDALDKLYSKDYDLLVTDVDMPRMNGFELTQKIKEDKKLKETPVIVVTARETTEDKRRGIEVGADAYIVKKEFDQSSLLGTIKKLIGK
jgi:two-component system chemotaxis sensor kinase CheA